MSEFFDGQAVNSAFECAMAGVLFRNLRHLTPPFGPGDIDLFGERGRSPIEAIWVEKGQIRWIGPDRKIPKECRVLREISLEGRTVLPGFVECHTHTVFAGSRSQEFSWRLAGQPYTEIYKKGGGILSTVRAVRAASLGQLAASAQKSVDGFVRQGVTTLEIKSGYGLDEKSELKLLKAIQSLAGPEIVSTYLGLHGLAPEFSTTDEYVDHVIASTLPKLKKTGLAKRCDIYIEKGFFSLEQGERFLRACHALDLAVVIHADQIHRTGATSLGARLSAMSCDHVIHVNDEDIRCLAASSTVAVLLPMADLYMKCAYPPARKMLDAGVRVALATDFNPGTCPSQDLSLVGLLARLEMKMTLEEVIEAYTMGAAHALGLEARKGQLKVGFDADFVVLEGNPSELFYSAGRMPVYRVYRGGVQLG